METLCAQTTADDLPLLSMLQVSFLEYVLSQKEFMTNETLKRKIQSLQKPCFLFVPEYEFFKPMSFLA